MHASLVSATPLSGRRKPARAAIARLNAALKRQDQRAFMNCLREVVKAEGGFARVARDSSLNRTALYRMVSARQDVRMSTLIALLSSVGLNLYVRGSTSAAGE